MVKTKSHYKNHKFNEHRKYAWVVMLITLLLYGSFLTGIIWSAVENYEVDKKVPIVETFLIMCTIVFVVFWYHTIFSLVLLVIKIVRRGKLFDFYKIIITKCHITKSKRVAILYTTKDDFIASALRTAFKQVHYDRKKFIQIDVFVLDDSKQKTYIKRINKFQEKLSIEEGLNFTIIRRNGIGSKNKAGNINNFLDKYLDSYDYFVIQDADTYLPHRYVLNCLKYFVYYSDVGIVQAANNRIVNSNNRFQEIMTPSHTNKPMHWALDGILLDKYATTMCTGHGCMISQECFKAVGCRYKDCISEDWSLSIDARNKGWYTAYAPNILCSEEIPPNYIAFKKRQIRWTGSAFQFCMQYHWKIIIGKFKFWEKLFLTNYTSNCWTTSFVSYFLNVFSFLILFFVPKGSQIGLLSIYFFITVVSLFFVGIIFVIINAWITKTSVRWAIKYSIRSSLVTNSMLPELFLKVLFVIFGGKNRFNRSIKHNKQMTFKYIFKNCWKSFILWIGLFALAISACCYAYYQVGDKYFYWLINPLLMFSAISATCIIPICYTSNFKNKHRPKDLN